MMGFYSFRRALIPGGSFTTCGPQFQLILSVSAQDVDRLMRGFNSFVEPQLTAS